MKAKSFLLNAALVIVVFLAASAFQSRNMLAADGEPAPALQGMTLEGRPYNLAEMNGRPALVYFFAPWCFYCRHSIDNLDDLVASGQLAWARVVALEYENLDEVREFIQETDVQLPVLLGSPQTTTDWQIRGFPTYFVIDGDGKIVSRSVGYSTKIGLQIRAWLHED